MGDEANIIVQNAVILLTAQKLVIIVVLNTVKP